MNRKADKKELSCDLDDSHTLSKPDETENNISDNVGLNESESEQKELSCDLDVVTLSPNLMKLKIIFRIMWV